MNKFVTDEKDIIKIKTDDLICKNCLFKSMNVNTCIAFENGKPLSVINDDKCKYYKRGK